MRWLILGASPSAPKQFGIRADAVASSGDAITLRRPDYYFVNESAALRRYIKERLAAQQLGTKVVVTKWMWETGPLHRHPYDIVLDVDFHKAVTDWEPGDTIGTVSGGIALQFAVNNGATEVHMVGMEGYTGRQDYFTGRSSRPCIGQTKYPSLLQRIVTQSPGVEFITYGNLNYPLRGENVSWHEALKQSVLS